MAEKALSYRQEQNIKTTVKYNEVCSQLPYYMITWLNAKAAANRKLSTRLAYAGDMLLFLRYCVSVNPLLKDTATKDIPLEYMEHLSSEDIIAYLAHLTNGIRDDGHMYTNNEKTRKRRLNSLRSFFKFEYSHKYISDDPTASIEPVKMTNEKFIRKLDADQVDTLVNSLTNNKSSSRRQKFSEKTILRDSAIVELLLNTGVRISELVGLNLNDVDFDSMCMYVTRKGGSIDRVYFNDTTAAALYDYIHSERPNYVKDENEQALFLSNRKTRLQVRSVQDMLQKLGEEALPRFGNLHPHDLRRTYGTALYNSTHDIRLVADVLGHEHVETTNRYYVDSREDNKRRAAMTDVYGRETP